MNKTEMIQYVKKQLVQQYPSDPSCFTQNKNVFIPSNKTFFEITTFGDNAVIQADPIMISWCSEKYAETSAKEILDGESLYELETQLRRHGKKLGGEHLRFLYLHPEKNISPPQGYTYKLFEAKDLHLLKDEKAFLNALNFKRDVIAFGAYQEDNLVALAGADDYMGNLWQIGIDTFSEHRCKGLGTYLVKTLADEIIKAGAVPFYTTWSPNIGSMNLALSAGFTPIWLSYFAENL